MRSTSSPVSSPSTASVASPQTKTKPASTSALESVQDTDYKDDSTPHHAKEVSPLGAAHEPIQREGGPANASREDAEQHRRTKFKGLGRFGFSLKTISKGSSGLGTSAEAVEIEMGALEQKDDLGGDDMETTPVGTPLEQQDDPDSLVDFPPLDTNSSTRAPQLERGPTKDSSQEATTLSEQPVARRLQTAAIAPSIELGERSQPQWRESVSIHTGDGAIPSPLYSARRGTSEEAAVRKQSAARLSASSKRQSVTIHQTPTPQSNASRRSSKKGFAATLGELADQSSRASKPSAFQDNNQTRNSQAGGTTEGPGDDTNLEETEK